MPRHRTTDPGYTNTHGQKVISRTGFPSETFPGQKIYHLRCTHCGHDYGANGTDIHLRRCPRHQNGAKGEPFTRSRTESFLPGNRLNIVICCDSLGKCALVCPDLMKVRLAKAV